MTKWFCLRWGCRWRDGFTSLSKETKERRRGLKERVGEEKKEKYVQHTVYIYILIDRYSNMHLFSYTHLLYAIFVVMTHFVIHISHQCDCLLIALCVSLGVFLIWKAFQLKLAESWWLFFLHENDLNSDTMHHLKPSQNITFNPNKYYK